MYKSLIKFIYNSLPDENSLYSIKQFEASFTEKITNLTLADVKIKL